MKANSLSALSLFLCISFLGASPVEQQVGAKITRNEAEHIVLARYPDARVTAAKLETVQGKLVWLIEMARPKSKQTTDVAVDAMTGRLSAGKKGEH
jgi:uncharacterized membrane protein YkoI